MQLTEAFIQHLTFTYVTSGIFEIIIANCKNLGLTVTLCYSSRLFRNFNAASSSVLCCH